MNKVPVGASIAHAYEFLFGRFFQIVGTSWVPALLFALVCYVNLTAMHPLQVGPDGAALLALAAASLVTFALFLMIRAVLGISLTQEALGVRKDMTLAHFVVGRRELRLFFGYLRFYVVFVALYAAVIVIFAGGLFLARRYGSNLAPSLALHGRPVATIVAVVVGIVAAVLFALSMMRLYFLLAPVASAEHRMRLARAWELTGGSTLRIFIVYLGTFLPAVVAFWGVSYYALGPAHVSALIQAFRDVKPGNPPPVGAFIGAHAATLALLSAVFVAIEASLLAGASAAAYRAVTGHEDPEPEDDALLVASLAAPVEDHAHHEEPAAHEDHHGDGGNHGHGGHEEGHGHDESSDGHSHTHEDQQTGGHEEHGHEDHGHGGHEAHGHDAHGHDDRGRNDHADRDHAHPAHHSDAGGDGPDHPAV